jgi:hypothetical protein
LSSQSTSPEAQGSATTTIRLAEAKAPLLLKTAKVTIKTVPGSALVSIPQPYRRYEAITIEKEVKIPKGPATRIPLHQDAFEPQELL